METVLICPICLEKLNLKDKSYHCFNNHNFDLAKEGYLNLLLINQRKSNEAGDSQEMVDSRRAYLEQDFYLPLSNILNSSVEPNLGEKTAIKILDAGCNEGYYTSRLDHYLKAKGIQTFSYGLDISKYALKIASKKYPAINFIISNIAHKFPFADKSFDVIINIFAPRNVSEFKRVLSDDGSLIVVFPSSDHLKGLRDKLGLNLEYQDKPEELTALFSKDFELVDTQKLESSITLSKNNAILLTKMTPMYWQIEHQLLSDLGEITTQIGFNIYTFKKTIT